MKRVKSPPAWLVKGAMVDYHAIIGESATEFNLRVRTDPQLMCDHWSVWLEGKAGSVSVDACTEATGSLGPSNDDSPHVQLEMRAAELEDTEHWGPASMSVRERWGFSDHIVEGDTSEPNASTDEYQAGFLAAEIESHEVLGRDATAWAWDISRPLAEQLAETAADDAASDALVDESNKPDGAL